jgi:hypothetical protein
MRDGTLDVPGGAFSGSVVLHYYRHPRQHLFCYLSASAADSFRKMALFSLEGSRIVVSDIFRDPNQPKGCAGQMLADAFAKVDASRPAVIRHCNILDAQPTTIDIQRGTAPKDTVLGRMLLQLVQALGGRISQWRHGLERDKDHRKNALRSSSPARCGLLCRQEDSSRSESNVRRSAQAIAA